MVDAERRGDWMQTFSGVQYWPLDPRAEDVRIEDIAHHLSMICRYCGACSRFYSVAEHSIGVLSVVEEHLRWRRGHGPNPGSVADMRLRRHALLHDAPEAYCHDLIRPIKRSITGYDEIEAGNWQVIMAALELDDIGRENREIIKIADNAMLLSEQAVLMKPAPAKWAPVEVPAHMLATARDWMGDGMVGYTPAEAKAAFLAEWGRLG